MGNRGGLAKIRLWCLGVVVAAGFVGTLLSLARVQRSASKPQGSEDGEAPREPGSALASRAGQAGRVGRPHGLGALFKFIWFWVFAVVSAAVVGGMFLAAGIDESNDINPTTVPAKASVIRSWAVNDQGDSQNYAYVRFKTKSGQIIHTQIEPDLATVARGQHIPILYNPAKPHQAGYAGPGGDSIYAHSPLTSGPPAFSVTAVAWSLAVILAFTGLWQLIGITRADPIDIDTPVRLRISRRMAYADHISGNYGLEWRLLDTDSTPRNMAGDAHILGRPTAGRMLIVRLHNGQLVWPASRAQLVLASGKLRLPEVKPGRIGSLQLLLAGYAQIVDLLSALPLVIRRPPGAQAKWWEWFGALRPTVKTLITLHLRRRLNELGSALLREALLCEPDSQFRRILAQTSEECQAFARTLPRHNLFAVLATIAATSITIVSPFLLLPQISLSALAPTGLMLTVLAGVLIFSVAPISMFYQSIRYKRALFNPASGSIGQPAAELTQSASTDWDVYELERAAFTAVAVPQPVEWESRQPIRRLIGVICFVPVVIGLYKLPLQTLIILGAAAAWIAARRIYRWLRRIYSLRATADQAEPVEGAAG